ncbi:MAG: cell wall hydrolase [Beijerinckiaceae bacterium]
MRLRKRYGQRPPVGRPLKPWILAAGVLVSFTATAGIRTTVDPSMPGLRFGEDPVSVSLAWPTLTAPDIAIAAEDFIQARPAIQTDAAEPEQAPQFQPGFWRGAQPTDGSEDLYEATPEISVLFRLDTGIMPLAKPFEADDGGPMIGAFSGLADAVTTAGTDDPANAPAQAKAQIGALAETPALAATAASKDTIIIASVAVPAALPLPAPSGLVKVALPPPRPVKPLSPLVGTVTSEKEMKCLAEAVYFESRSEPERGQAGVAQVVLNRARSGVYPPTVCGVVYQNRHRYLACQFTFACEGKSLRITEPGPWSTAMRIARDVAEGRTYLPGIGNATHYHANYVRPWWVRHMDKREKVGKHVFYFEAAEN